ncbi:amine oxidase [Lentithecium fluviatile CBS 122367]|uniref:Amine oxidase n=1 Tax=Lentithecium fluviatile CBS 122367 TaxID=1168545 RepID=A0A6G1IU54_9PLEO|nr:amine oxidase [Lentithecium fluviatile CBS 122367]
MTAPTCSAFTIKFCLYTLLCKPWASLYCPPAPPASVDIAIIGGGLAGLTTAHELLSAGHSVLVLEARKTIGGKVQNRELKNGGIAEVGAEFVGPTQDKILDLIDELGLQTFDTYDEGKYVFWRKGVRTEYEKHWLVDAMPPVSWFSVLQMGFVQVLLDTMAGKLNVSAPWSHPKAPYWDSMSFEEWLHGWIWSADAMFMMECVARSVWGAEARELSLLYVLSYIAGAGNEMLKGSVDRLLSVKGGGQEKRVVGGTGLIPIRLAERVGWGNIMTGAVVYKVTEIDGRYEIQWGGGSVRADKVVLALGPTLVKRITFSPDLPDNRKRLNEGWTMGAMSKAIAAYSTPFWRHPSRNLNAQAFTDRGAVGVTFDNSPEDGSFGAIMGFFDGDQARRVETMSPSAVQAEVLEDLVRYFGEEARNATDFVMQRWGLEEHIWGGPNAVAPPGMLGRYGESMREVVGGIHFAGAETNAYWAGYMDGAVRSGMRVAREILDS